MAVGDAFKAAITKAGLDAARESAAALTQALRDAEAAAAALNKRGPMTPQEAATAEVRRLAREAREAEAAVKALGRAQAQAAAAGARSAGGSERKDAADRAARMRKGLADAAREQRAGKAATDKKEEEKAGGGKGAPKDLKYLLKHAGVGKAAMGAIGAAGGLELSKLALGQRGMAMLGALSTRTGFQIRQLFSGVDPMPVVRAADRFSQLFNKATATGHAISGIFGRVFNSLFGGVEKAEPIFFAFAEGMVGGALQIENAYLRTRIALLPLTDAIEDLIGPMDGIETAATAGGVALVALGGYAAIAAAPMIPLSLAALAVVKALEQLAKLQKEIAGAGGVGQAAKDMARHFIEGTGKEGEDAAAARGRAGFDAAEAARAAKAKAAGGAPAAAAPADAGAAGMPTGKAYADGVAQGVAAGAPKVAGAGKDLVKTLDASTRAAGEIHSPSRLAFRTGREFPAGTAQGIDDGAGLVDDAAARSMVPRGGGATAGASMASAPGAMSGAEVIALLKQIEANTRPGMNQPQRTAQRMGGIDLHGIGRSLGVPTA